MQKSLFRKFIVILGLTFLIAFALMMIESTIAERMHFHSDAVRSIAADSVSEQTVLGPVLVIPYSELYQELETDASTKQTTLRQYVIQHRQLVYPDTLKVRGKLDTDHRYRGIHQVLVYSGQHVIEGDFVVPAIDSFHKDRSDSQLRAGRPFLAVGISDTRGLHSVPSVMWNNQAVEFQQESGLTAFQHGIHAPLAAMELHAPEHVTFSMALNLDGIESMQFVPIGKNNQVTWTSPWPHPQFTGRFLPSTRERSVSAKGFAATWNISSLSSSAQQQLSTAELAQGDNKAPAPALDSFSVAFIEPVNIYTQADRAVKYGLLFVALTFAAFFLFEVLKRLPIHPVQYALVGLALALFFLLLVSLSEHIDFVLAYLIASTACIVLIGFYLSHVLRDWRRGLGFGAALTLLYAVLFGLLQSENNALVMGSILLFGLLSAIMVATRKVDWYQLGRAAPAEADAV